MRINWKLFEDNSSTVESVVDFATSRIKTYDEWISACWPPSCKEEIRRIRNHPFIRISTVRDRAKRKAREWGF